MKNIAWVRILIVVLAGLACNTVFAQEEKDNCKRLAERKVRKMIKAGFEFSSEKHLIKRCTNMFEKEQAMGGEGQKPYVVIEVTSKHKDQEIAVDLMRFKLPVELASWISNEIRQMIESELVQSTTYWELGGHDYFLEVQQAIDEVAIATALNLTPVETIYEAKRQHNKNYEYRVGLIYDREKMMSLFIFEASQYEILDSIYWLNKSN